VQWQIFLYELSKGQLTGYNSVR